MNGSGDLLQNGDSSRAMGEQNQAEYLGTPDQGNDKRMRLVDTAPLGDYYPQASCSVPQSCMDNNKCESFSQIETRGSAPIKVLYTRDSQDVPNQSVPVSEIKKPEIAECEKDASATQVKNKACNVSTTSASCESSGAPCTAEDAVPDAMALYQKEKASHEAFKATVEGWKKKVAAQVERERATMISLQERCEKLEKELERAHTSCESSSELKERVSTLESELTAERRQHAEEVERLTSQWCDVARKEREDGDKRVKGYVAQISTLEDEIARLQSAEERERELKEKAQEALSAASENIDEHRREENTLQKHVTQLEGALSAAESELTLLRNELDKVCAELNRASQRAKEAGERAADLQSERAVYENLADLAFSACSDRMSSLFAELVEFRDLSAELMRERISLAIVRVRELEDEAEIAASQHRYKSMRLQQSTVALKAELARVKTSAAKAAKGAGEGEDEPDSSHGQRGALCSTNIAHKGESLYSTRSHEGSRMDLSACSYVSSKDDGNESLLGGNIVFAENSQPLHSPSRDNGSCSRMSTGGGARGQELNEDAQRHAIEIQYIKNILIRFISEENEKVRQPMVPALARVLGLSRSETQALMSMKVQK